MLLLILQVVFAVPLSENVEIESVLMIARSGASAPRQPMSSNQAINSWMDNSTVIANGLLPIGKRQIYLLGKQMRKDYSTLVSKMNGTYNDYSINSMSVPSALGSVQAFVLGFSPDQTTLDWDRYKSTIPILFPQSGSPDPVSAFKTPLPAGVKPLRVNLTKDGEVDYLYELSSPDVCPNVNSKTVESIIASWNTQFRFFDSYNKAVQSIELANSLSYFNQSTILYRSARIFEFVAAQALSGQAPVINSSSSVYKDLQTSYEAYTMSTLADRRTLQVVMAPLISDIVNYFRKQANVTAKQRTRLQVYFGHDKFVLGILTLLNLTTPDCVGANYSGTKNTNQPKDCVDFPRPSANLIFEVYRNILDESRHARLVYNGKAITKLAGVGDMDERTGLIPLDSLIKFLNSTDLVVKDWQNECGIMAAEIPNNKDLLIWLFYFSLSTVGLVIILGAVVWSIYWKSQGDDSSATVSTTNTAEDDMNLDDSLTHS